MGLPMPPLYGMDASPHPQRCGIARKRECDMKKRLWSILLCCALTLTLLSWAAPPAQAAAAAWSGYVSILADTTLGGGVTLTGDTTLAVAAGRTLTIEQGIDCGGFTLTFAGAGDVNVTGKEGSSGVSGSIVLSSGALTVSGRNGCGISGNVVQSGGTMLVFGGNAVAAQSEDEDGFGGDGIFGSVTLSGGTMTVSGGNGKYNYYGAGQGGRGINGDVTLSGGTLTATGGYGGGTQSGAPGGCGIFGSVTQSGGILTATGGDGGNCADGGAGNGGCGITPAVEISGGILNAQGGNGGYGGYGGYGGDGISGSCTLRGGIVTADGGSGVLGSYDENGGGEDGSGIFCLDGSNTFSGGAVKASCFRISSAAVAAGRTYTIDGAGSFTGTLDGSTLSAAAGHWFAASYRTGSCGSGTAFELIQSGSTSGNQSAFILLISGTGATADYNAASALPWAAQKDRIVTAMIGSGVTGIGKGVFSYCAQLAEIHVDQANPNYSSENGILFSKDKRSLLCCPAGTAGSFVIPDGVTAIAGSAFSGCANLTSVTIPDSVTSAGSGAFQGCTSLEAVYSPYWLDLSNAGIPSGTAVVYKPSLNGGRVTASAGAVLFVAEYEANGRLKAARSAVLNRDYKNETPPAGLNVPASGRYKLFLADGLTFAPLCAAWDSAA